ncbi:MAG: DMT family transporter [Firmicutes bacterium]|nr:DMT family transporter [Bacillota bacterium]
MKDVTVVKTGIVPLLLAAGAGTCMALQGAMNSLLGKGIGLARATFLVQATGALLAGILLFFPWPGSFAELAHLPWYALLGGPLGVAIVFLVAESIAKAGAGPATTAIIVAQLLLAYLLDHFGLFGLERLPFSAWKALGIILIAAGGWLLLGRA